MKCSSCSAKIRPVLVTDIDGTIGNYHLHCARFIIHYWNLKVDLDEVMAWDGEGEWNARFGITKAQYREAKLAFRQGGMKRLMPTFADNGLTMIRNMSAMGVDIWYATTRPWQRLDNIDPDTRFWLEKHHMPIGGLMYDEMKYEVLVRDFLDPERIIGVIDDLPEQYDSAKSLELPVFQIARQHNSGLGAKRPVRGTMDWAQSWVIQNLREWRIEHGY